MNSVADPNGVREFDSNERIVDVATALTADNQSKILHVMEKYGATYFMIGKDDMIKAVWFFRIAESNSTDYIDNLDSVLSFTDAGEQTMISKLLNNQDTDFALVYEDQQMKINELDLVNTP